MRNRIKNIETAVITAFAVLVLAGCGGGGASQTSDMQAAGGAGTLRNLAAGTAQGGSSFPAVNGGGLNDGAALTSPAESGGIPPAAPTVVGAEGNAAAEEGVDVSQFLIQAITESPGGADSDTNGTPSAEQRL